MDYFQILSTVMQGDIKAPSLFVIMLDYEKRPINYRGGEVTALCFCNLVPRVFSLSNMAAAGEKTLAHSRNHVTDLSTESGNLFKMAAKLKSERIWVRGLMTW